MIFLPLLVTTLINVYAPSASSCPGKLKFFAAASQNSDAHELFFEAYASLIHPLNLEELRQLEVAPLRLPVMNNLVSISSVQEPLQKLLEFSNTSVMSSLSSDALAERLRGLVRSEILKRTHGIESQQVESTKFKDLKTNRMITLGGRVKSLALSPDGGVLYSGSDDGVIRLWNAVTGDALRNQSGDHIVLKGHSSGINSLVLSADGRILYSGSDDHSVRMWNAVTGEALRSESGDPVVLKFDKNWIRSLAFSRDGRIFYGGLLNDREFQLWDAVTGEALQNQSGDHIVLKGWVVRNTTSIFLSPDSRVLYSGLDLGHIWLWDAVTGEALQNQSGDPIVLKGHSEWVRSLALSPDGRILYSGSDDAEIRIWDAKSGRALRNESGEPIVLIGHSNYITSLVLSPDGRVLYSGSENGSLRIWHLPDYLPAEYLGVSR